MANQSSHRQPRMSPRLITHYRSAAPGEEFAQGCLRVRCTVPRRDVRLLTVLGEVDQATAPLLLRVMHTGEQAAAVVVDMTGVGFLGFAGVDVLLTAADRAEQRGRGFAVVAATRPTRRALQLARADERIPCYPRLELAMRAVADPSASN